RMQKNLSDFKRGQIVGAQVAGLSVRKTAQLYDVSSRTVVKVMSAYNKDGFTAAAQKSKRQKPRAKRKRLNNTVANGEAASDRPVSDCDTKALNSDERKGKPESQTADEQ
uniref:Uncharacterized protein n=1 Tax=Stegastes partitus TaxID=144197 RepID=A0A3B4ZLM7_9TELE